MSKTETQRQARLNRGVSYTLRDGPGPRDSRVFQKGEWENVTADEEAHLRKNAVDVHTVNPGGNERPYPEKRDKFEFRDKPDDAEAEEGSTPTVRPRTRRA